MKIAILETGHFQYALTLSDIFSGADKIFITDRDKQNEMFEYAPELCDGEFFFIDSIRQNERDIIEKCRSEAVELLMINPVFDSYRALLRITKELDCIKVLTTHNVNTWFNGRFWSPNSLGDRINMKKIINNCNYIAVEDFIFNHLKTTNHKWFRRHSFIYIPFTIFHQNQSRTYLKEDKKLKVVLTGSIASDRRRYEGVLEVIKHFLSSNAITFSFAGPAKGEYGRWVQSELDKLNKESNGIASYFDDHQTPESFKKEMETSDLVLSTSAETFKGMGTTEYIGKTKPTAAIHDMITYELPGLLPNHMAVPPNLEGSVFNYENSDELINTLTNLIEKNDLLDQWKRKAKENSRKFTADKIRKGLPFGDLNT